jgi:MFS family permease
VQIDGAPALDSEGRPLRINAYSPAARYELTTALRAESPGEHTLRLAASGERDPRSTGSMMSLAAVQVLPPLRQNRLPVIIGLILALEAVCLLLALALGRLLFARAAQRMDTKRSLMLALIVYTAITIWGFFLDSVVEFWCLAWLVACVQGGSQALSRSLFSTMIPAQKSGEYFGLFGVMEKAATILGPLVFAAAGTAFGSSRPAVLSLIVFFIVGMLLLARVDVEAGRRLAREEEARLGSLEK